MAGILASPVIGAVLGIISKIVPDVNTQNRIREALVQGAVQGDLKLIDAQSTIIGNEAANTNWLASCWRPITMLVFLAMVVSAWFGYVPSHMPPEVMTRLFDIIQYGLCGYIGARSIEKSVTSVVGKFVNK